MPAPNRTQWVCIYNALRRNKQPANTSAKAVQKACDAVLADIANHRPDILKQWDIRVGWNPSTRSFVFDISDRSAIEQLGHVVEPVKPKTDPPVHGRSRSESALMSTGRQWTVGMVVRAVEHERTGVIKRVCLNGKLRVKWDKHTWDRINARLSQWVDPGTMLLKVIA